MYLVTSPDNVLLGAKDTLKEAKKLVEWHALHPKEEKPTDDELRTLADPDRWQKLLARYKVERVK